MPVRIEGITMDCRDERRLSAVWTSALGYEIAVDQPGDWMVLKDPSGAGPSIGLQVVPKPKVVKNRVHLDLIPTEGELETEIRRSENLGGGGCATSGTIPTNRTGSWPIRKAMSSAMCGRPGTPGNRGRRPDGCRRRRQFVSSPSASAAQGAGAAGVAMVTARAGVHMGINTRASQPARARTVLAHCAGGVGAINPGSPACFSRGVLFQMIESLSYGMHSICPGKITSGSES
jgi:hypothetical protein